MDAAIKQRSAALFDHVHSAPVPVEKRPSREEAEAAVRALIAYIGDNPTREGLQATPKRVVAALDELYRGYREVPAKALIRTFGETEPYDDFVLIRDIGFTSHCEHHMMPFYGKAHVAYRPVERVVGLSKLARLVDVYARRLQTQEQLTSQVAAAIEDVLKPHGVAVLIEAEHTCISVRGVSKPGVSTVTTRFLGTFRDSPKTRCGSSRWCAAPRLRADAGRVGDSSSDTSPFAAPGSSADLEEGFALTPKFDGDGLVTCVATDAVSGDVLMVAHMNARRWQKPSPPARRGISAARAAHYGRRARRAATPSGRQMPSIAPGCVWIKVEQIAGACHTGRRSCFYRAVPLGKAGSVTLEFRDERVFDPKTAYRAED